MPTAPFPRTCRIALLLGAATTASATAQTGPYVQREIARTAGLNGHVDASTTWDPDGPGPVQPWTVFFGQFTRAGSITVTKAAAWDGERWHAIPDAPSTQGGNDSRVVIAAGEWNGKLVAVVSAPLMSVQSGLDPTTVSLYDGASWTPLPTYPMGLADSPIVHTFNGDLIVTGRAVLPDSPPSAAARWDGTAWHPLGPNPGSGPFSSALLDGSLVAAITPASADPTVVVARWGNAGWDVLSGSDGGARFDRAPNLSMLDGELIAWRGGMYTADDVAVDGLARWDGISWQALPTVPSPNPAWQSLVAEGGPGGLLAIGDRVLGSASSSECFLFDDGAWSPLPSPLSAMNNPLQYDIAPRDNSFILSTASASFPFPLLGVQPVVWNGTQWGALGEGLDGSFTASGRAMDQICFGVRTAGPGHPRARVLVRGNDGLSQLGGVFSLETGPAAVWAVTEQGGTTVAAGAFDRCAGEPCGPVVGWSTGRWQTLGGGLTGEPLRLCTEQGVLYAFGRLSVDQQPPAYRVVRLTNGLWENVGPSLAISLSHREVSSLDVINGVVALGFRGRENYSFGTASLHVLRDGAWSVPWGTATGNFPIYGAARRGADLVVLGVLPIGMSSSSPKLFSFNGTTLTELTGPLGQPPRITRGDGYTVVSAGTLMRLEDNNTLAVIGNTGGSALFLEADRAEIVVVASVGRGASVKSFSRACGTTDLATVGATPTPDGRVSNDDVIVFIDEFFTRSWRTDVGVQGGLPGVDGEFDNNDFIVFLDLFFAGC